MKLQQYYSLKKSKSNEIISFTFSFTDAHSKIRREKRQLRNRLFAHEGRLFLSEICEKRPEYDNFGLFLRPSSISLYKKSSLYFKIVDFLPKNDRYVSFRNVEFNEIVSIKKGTSDKSNESNVGESVSLNLAPQGEGKVFKKDQCMLHTILLRIRIRHGKKFRIHNSAALD